MTSRHRAWTLTWIAYATYYLGRKAFSAVKKPLGVDLGLGPAALGAVDTGFLGAYALGQFLSGFLGDRVGARRLIGCGMIASALVCGLTGSASLVSALIVLACLNGLAQSTGWPGTTRAMAEWTTLQNRGVVMGYWLTCYQFGGLVAVPLAAEVAQRFGWRAAFYAPALALGAVGVLVLLFLPEKAGAARDAGSATSDASRSARAAAQKALLRSPTLWLLGGSYFFIKLVRYALLFWLPFYLSERAGYSTAKAGWVSAAFDAGGLLGVVLIGRSTSGSRPARSALWLLGLVAALVLYTLAGDQGTVMNVVLLALIGALLFGPDSLLSGAAAQDAGGEHAPAMATGFVNGIGSIGGMAQGLAVPWLAARFGWTALFPCLVVFSLLAAVALVPILRAPVPR